jgi:hypothetical protein
MAKLAIFLLITLLLPCSVRAVDRDLTVCVFNSYTIEPAKKLEKLIYQKLSLKNYILSDKNCDVEIVIGTPELMERLEKDSFKKLIYTFVLFPEEVKTDKENVYGVRIFPLPERTLKAFKERENLKEITVAAPISRRMVKIAQLYLDDEEFKKIIFSESPTEIYGELKRYRYVYIFPDPKLLKRINMIDLITFGKKHGIKFLSGLGDLKEYGVDFVQEVSYEKLAEALVSLIEEEPEERILPCPVKQP